MSYHTKSGYDNIFGHYCFQSAVDRASEAQSKHHVEPGVKADFKEAIRLYRVAIADAEIGFREIAADAEWSRACADAVRWAKVKVAQWQETIAGLEKP